MTFLRYNNLYLTHTVDQITPSTLATPVTPYPPDTTPTLPTTPGKHNYQ